MTLTLVTNADTTHGADRDTTVRDAVMATLPMLLGYAPFGVVVGSSAARQGAPLAGWVAGFAIFGGSAQLATMRTFAQAGAISAILTGLLINARLVVYSASLSRRWNGQPRWFRVAAAPLIIDPTWAAAERHAQHTDDPVQQRRYFWAMAVTLMVGWTSAVAIGATAGATLSHIRLDVVVPLCLLALVGTSLRTRSSAAVVVVAAAVALATTSWPSGTGVLAAIAAGCLVARP